MPKAGSYAEVEVAALFEAALEVIGMAKRSKVEIHRKLQLAFVRHVAILAYGSEIAATAHQRDGAALWAKFGDLKRDFANIWRPIWNKCFPGSTLPSGTGLDEWKTQFKLALHREFEARKAEAKANVVACEKAKHVGERVALFSKVRL
jgi:hypothetical protein